MNSTEHNGVTFHFNSDFRGNVTIRNGKNEISIPAIAIRDFIAFEYVRPIKVQLLGEERADVLLGL